MWIADVNSYLAEKMDGSVKRKGRYEYDVHWHQNASSLVIPKVAEQVLLHGANVEQLVSEWHDWQDFYMRAKVPRSSHLLLRYPAFDVPMENTQRYYVSVGGGELVKVMPPLAKKPDQWREIGICKGWTVCPCNNLKDVVLPVNYDYYINEVKKLTEVFDA
jgi:(2Fe-2S) ferredoxin